MDRADDDDVDGVDDHDDLDDDGGEAIRNGDFEKAPDESGETKADANGAEARDRATTAATRAATAAAR